MADTLYIVKTYDQKKSRAEHRQWKRRFRREFLTGPVHEFRTWREVIRSGKDGEIVKTSPNRKFKTIEVKYRKVKSKKVYETVVGCLWHKLADIPGMPISDLRDIVEGYAYSYNAGFDPMTGNPLKDIKSFEFYTQKKNEKGEVISLEEKKVPKALDELQISKDMNAVPDEYGSKRNNIVPDEKVMKLLLDLICDDDFKAKVDALKKNSR